MRISDWMSHVCSSDLRQAYEFLGSPEGEYAVAQAIVYVATASKSNATYLAYHAARELAKATPGVYPPINIINHPTARLRSEEHTSELQSLMRISYAVFCLKKKKTNTQQHLQRTQNKQHKRTNRHKK